MKKRAGSSEEVTCSELRILQVIRLASPTSRQEIYCNATLLQLWVLKQFSKMVSFSNLGYSNKTFCLEWSDSKMTCYIKPFLLDQTNLRFRHLWKKRQDLYKCFTKCSILIRLFFGNFNLFDCLVAFLYVNE